MDIKLLFVLFCNFIFQFVIFRAYMYVYAYACPATRCIITSVRYRVQKNKPSVCLPLPSVNFWKPLSGSLSFIWSSTDKHISDI